MAIRRRGIAAGYLLFLVGLTACTGDSNDGESSRTSCRELPSGAVESAADGLDDGPVLELGRLPLDPDAPGAGRGYLCRWPDESAAVTISVQPFPDTQAREQVQQLLDRPDGISLQTDAAGHGLAYPELWEGQQIAGARWVCRDLELHVTLYQPASEEDRVDLSASIAEQVIPEMRCG